MFNLVLLRVLESYFRHRWLHLLPITLFAVGAIVYLVQLKPKYVAHGVLYVQNASLLSSLNSIRQEGFSWITPAQATAEEIGELMQSDAFVRAVIQETDLEQDMVAGAEAVNETIGDVRRAIWMFRQGKNQVVVGANYENPVVTYQLVSAVINTYIHWRINSDVQQSVAAQTFFDGLIEDYNADLETARRQLEIYLDSHPAPIRGDRPASEELEIERLRGVVNLTASRYASALEKRENTQLAMSETESDVRQTYYVLDAPRLPDRSEISKRQLAQYVLVFIVAGTIMSAVSIAGSALLDRTFRFPIDVAHRLELPVLGSVPTLHREVGATTGAEQGPPAEQYEDVIAAEKAGNGHGDWQQVKE